MTRKITLGLSRVVLGPKSHLELGNLDSKRGWGFAGDYVEGMWRMLNTAKADDYILATGETRTIREFAEKAATCLGVNLVWKGENEVGFHSSTDKDLIRINTKYYRPAEVPLLLGDSSKAERGLGWVRKADFDHLVEMMVKSDYDAFKSEKILF